MLSTVLTSSVVILNIFAIISIIFIEKKNPNSALGWILVLIVLPILGFLLYLFLGSSQKLKLTRKKYKIDLIEKECVKEIKKNIKLVNKRTMDDLFLLNNNTLINGYTADNNVKLYNNMNQAISMMFKDLINAKESINIEFFIFKTNSAVGEKLISILTQKANEGVKVRLIYDKFGAKATRKKHFKKLIKAGAEVYTHLPRFFKSFLEINYRNHRKVVIIDGVIAYTGGMNIGDEYLSLDDKITPWRDTFVRITGSSVSYLQMRFFSDFTYLKKLTLKRKYNENETKNQIKTLFKKPIELGNMGIQVVYNGPDTSFSYVRDGYLKIINNSKKFVYIETPYFIPDETLLDSLRIAVSSGVDVRIIIPGIPDKKFVYYVTLSFIEKLLEFGIKVYLYEGFIHSKTIVSDDEYSSLGTTNFDSRSFRLNYEINTFIKSKIMNNNLKQAFFDDIKNSKEVIKNKFKIGKIKKFMSLIYRLLSPIL